MSNFKHYLITRFNVGVYDTLEAEYHKRGKTAPSTREWTDYRFEIFKSYTFPSVYNQTCSEFVWLVLMDDKTPPDIQNAMANLSRKFPAMEIVKIHFNHRTFFDANNQSVQEYLRPRHGSAAFLMTTRIDGDDAINLEFVQRLQAGFDTKKVGEAITFIYGCAHNPKTKKTLCRTHGTNMFLSSIELWDETVTSVLPHHHRHWAKYHYLDDDWRETRTPMWLYCAEHQNLINEMGVRGVEIGITDINSFFGTNISP